MLPGTGLSPGPTPSSSCQSSFLGGHLSVSRHLSNHSSSSQFPSSLASTRLWKIAYFYHGNPVKHFLPLPCIAWGNLKKKKKKLKQHPVSPALFFSHQQGYTPLHVLFPGTAHLFPEVCALLKKDLMVGFLIYLPWQLPQRQRSAFCGKGYEGTTGDRVVMTLSSYGC